MACVIKHMDDCNTVYNTGEEVEFDISISLINYEIDDINELMRQLYIEYDVDVKALTRKDIVSVAKNPDRFTIFLEEYSLSTGRRIFVGMGNVLKFQTYHGYIGMLDDIIVHEDFRRKGYGELIVNKLLSVAKEWGLDCVDLSSGNKRFEAHALYTKLGFVKYTDGTMFYKYI